MNSPRRRAHQQTPVIVGLFAFVCVFGNGALTVLRDTQRATLSGHSLNWSEKTTAFEHGCGWGFVLFLGLFLGLYLIVGFSLIIEEWRWRRTRKKSWRA